MNIVFRLPDFGCLPCLHHVHFCMGDFAIDKVHGVHGGLNASILKKNRVPSLLYESSLIHIMVYTMCLSKLNQSISSLQRVYSFSSITFQMSVLFLFGGHWPVDGGFRGFLCADEASPGKLAELALGPWNCATLRRSKPPTLPRQIYFATCDLFGRIYLQLLTTQYVSLHPYTYLHVRTCTCIHVSTFSYVSLHLLPACHSLLYFF